MSDGGTPTSKDCLLGASEDEDQADSKHPGSPCDHNNVTDCDDHEQIQPKSSVGFKRRPSILKSRIGSMLIHTMSTDQSPPPRAAPQPTQMSVCPMQMTATAMAVSALSDNEDEDEASVCDLLGSAISTQEELVRHVTNNYLARMQDCVKHVTHGKVTLAQMARYFHYERITECLEGVIWYEKELLEGVETHLECLTQELQDHLLPAIARINKESNIALEELTGFPLHNSSGKSVERSITRYRNHVDNILQVLGPAFSDVISCQEVAHQLHSRAVDRTQVDVIRKNLPAPYAAI